MPGTFGQRIVLRYKDSDFVMQFYPQFYSDDEVDTEMIFKQARMIVKEYEEGRL